MAYNKGGIKRSRLHTHPLAGRAGLLREIGASHNHGVVLDAWARGLGDRQLWNYVPRPDAKDTDVALYTNLIHDETTQFIIAGLNRRNNNRLTSSV